MTYNGFQSSVDAVLCEAIRCRLPKQAQGTTRTAKVELNGRIYWMVWGQVTKNYATWDRLAWPDDDVVEVRL